MQYPRSHEDIGEAVAATLETLERHGGKTAFAHIKQCVPTCKTQINLKCVPSNNI